MSCYKGRTYIKSGGRSDTLTLKIQKETKSFLETVNYFMRLSEFLKSVLSKTWIQITEERQRETGEFSKGVKE